MAGESKAEAVGAALSGAEGMPAAMVGGKVAWMLDPGAAAGLAAVC